MLWLSDDDGDPPWWMWVLMVLLTIGGVFLVRYGLEQDSHMFDGPRHNRTLRLCFFPLMGCVFWFAARLWFWFDKS